MRHLFITLLCLTEILQAAKHPVRLATPCGEAGARLTAAWDGLQLARQTADGCAQDRGLRCEALKAQIERLGIDCPDNGSILLANALLAFDARNFVRAQQMLDQLVELKAFTPDAGVLRGRIALEQGNVQFAIRFLGQQVQQIGDHAGLREVFASALYFAGRLKESREQLEIAARLNAPVWRVLYGKGLIEESLGNFAVALKFYQDAQVARPGWNPPASRARALVASGAIPKPH